MMNYNWPGNVRLIGNIPGNVRIIGNIIYRSLIMEDKDSTILNNCIYTIDTSPV